MSAGCGEECIDLAGEASKEAAMLKGGEQRVVRIASRPDAAEDTRTRLRVELSSIVQLSIPIVITSVLNFVMNVVDLAMVGHLGKEELAAASLGLAYYNTVYFPLSGVAMALDTLFSQAYGAKNYRLYGIWLLTGGISIAFVSVFVSLLLLAAETVLVSIKMEGELSAKAAMYVTYLVPGMFPNIAFSVVQKYLQSQGILKPCVYIALISNVINVLGNYLLIYVFALGLGGAPMATSVTRTLQLFAALLFLRYSTEHSRTWPCRRSMSMLGMEHFNTFIRLGSTGWLMIALEAWAFDIGQLLAGYTDHVSLGAHASMQTVCGFTYMSFPLALSIAVSIRVGHLLGAGDHLQAQVAARVTRVDLLIVLGFLTVSCCLLLFQVAARVTILLTLLFMGSLAMTYLALRHHVGWVFSGDADVVRTFAAITPIAALFQVFDGLQSACAGVFRGMGRNKVVALLNFFGLWVIGQSLGVTLAFFVGTRLGWTGGGGGEGGGGGGGGGNMTLLETHELADPPRGIGVYGLWWGLAAGKLSKVRI